MAMKFYPGQTNVLEVLNQMGDAFERGPFNALPLTGGNLTGPVNSTARITADSFVSPKQIIAGVVGSGSASSIRAANDGAPGVYGTEYEVAALSVAGVSGFGYAGRFYWGTQCAVGLSSLYAPGYRLTLRAYDSSPGSTATAPLLTIDGTGDLTVGRDLIAGRSVRGNDFFPKTDNAYTVGTSLLRFQTVYTNKIDATTDAKIGGYLTAGFVAQSTVKHMVYGGGAEFVEILNVGRVGTSTKCISVNGSNGLGGWGNTKSVLYVGKNSETSSSIRAAGTIGASGADYAEYLIKSLLCGTVAPGQIIGIDADGRLTDKWDRAITFMVKSTNPCMVGGDSWGQHLGARPEVPVRIAPTVEQVLVTPGVPADEASGTEAVPPVYGSITTAPGDTDDEWAAKQAAHEAALAAFEVALEAARQTVDRIAFAGQVPVNVLGATPGQYIVPVQDSECITGVAVDEDDMNLKQYMRAVGKVIAIEDDGRARIIVKAV